MTAAPPAVLPTGRSKWLEREWSRYLVPDAETILFNHAFFEAEPEELLPLARALNIKP